MPLRRAARWALLLMLSCMDEPREQRVVRREREPVAAVAAAPRPAPVVRARAARPAPEPAAEPIDPALVPVEEDFRGDVERRIGRRTDLERELQRVSRELAKRQ